MKRQIIVGWILLGLCLAGVAHGEEAQFQDGKWVSVASPDDNSPAGKLARIRQLLIEKRPSKAFDEAKRFCRDYPNDKGVEEAMNLAGQAQIQRRRWWQAYEWYEKQVDRFAGGALYDRALTREAEIGEAFLAGAKRRTWYLLRLSAKDEGLDILRKVADRLPGTALADRCLMGVADSLAADEKWEEAAEAYKQYGLMFRGRYRSQHAELRAAETTYSQFSGTRWDDTPLVEAEQLYQTFLRRYPNSEAANGVAAVLTEIEQAKVQKEHETAMFYTRIGRPTAAAYYHREVVAQYPGTTWADLSAKALATAAEAGQVGATDEDQSK